MRVEIASPTNVSAVVADMEAFPAEFLALAAPPTPPSAITKTDHDTLSWRERRRLSERKSREKRKGNLDAMRKHLEALECAAANVALAVDGHPKEFENEGSEMDRHMRAHLRRTILLTKEARRLANANAELGRMLKEHEITVKMLRVLTKGMEVDEWTQKTERWKALTLAMFTPWTVEQCWEMVALSMKEIGQFHLDESSETTGLSFMGWRDRRKLNIETGTVQFRFTKRYRDMDAESMAKGYWDMHLDGRQYARCMLGSSVKLYYDVVQHVTPDIFLVRYVEQYASSITIHMLAMIFRVRTNTGFLLGLRAIPCPDLMRATDDEGEYWNNNFHWVKWDILARDAKGECIEIESSVNGSLVTTTTEYANHWMGEAILTLVRAESALLGRSFLKSG